MTHLKIKILISSGSKKGPGYITLFTQKVPASEFPPCSPVGPLWKEIPAYGTFLCLSLNISLSIFPSESLVRKPPPCSLTGSPSTGILHHQNHISQYNAIANTKICLEFVKEKEPEILRCVSKKSNLRAKKYWC